MPWPYRQRSWQFLGPGVVLRVSMKEDRSWLRGEGLFRLSQGLRVQPRHKLCARMGLSPEHDRQDQDAMEYGGPGSKVWWK